MPARLPPPYKWAGDGLRLLVRLTPGARRDAVEGLKPTASGGSELVVKLRAVPEKGRANAALVKFITAEFGLAPHSVALAHGATDRHKQLSLQGDAAALAARLDQYLAQLPAPRGETA